MTAAVSQPRRGRQRSEAAGEAILQATLALLAESGYGGLTMAAVIERAGVSSATLYRRWTTKQDLVGAAVATLVPELGVADTGSLKGDLALFVRQVAHSISVRHEGVAEALRIEKKHNPALAAALRGLFLQPRLDELKAVLARAKERGEISVEPPVEVAFSLITGPLYHRAFHLNESLTPTFVKSVATWATRALQR